MSFKVITSPLNEFITLQRGFDLPSKDRIKGKIPIVASTGVGGFHNEFRVKAPGVVIGRSGSIGGGQYVTEDFWPLNTTLWVKDFKGHNPRYVYYLLRSIDFSGFNVGTGVPTLNRNHLSSIDVVVIDRESENKVAEILGMLDDKIQLNHQINQTLEQIAQALFKSWFVDFDPVKAKIDVLEAGGSEEEALLAAMQVISSKNAGELAAFEVEKPEEYAELRATAELFPAAMVESELGEIPEGWGVCSIDQVCTTTDYVANGSFRALKENVNLLDQIGDVIYVRTTDHNKGFSSDLKYTDLKSYEFLSKTKLFGRETIISNVGDVGTVFRAPTWFKMPMTLGSNAIALISGSHDGYLFHLFKSTHGQHLIQSIVTGSAQLKFNKTNLRSLRVIWPTKELLAFFEKKEKTLHSKNNALKEEVLHLEGLRDTLLPKLLSGEVDVLSWPSPYRLRHEHGSCSDDCRNATK